VCGPPLGTTTACRSAAAPRANLVASDVPLIPALLPALTHVQCELRCLLHRRRPPRPGVYLLAVPARRSAHDADPVENPGTPSGIEFYRRPRKNWSWRANRRTVRSTEPRYLTTTTLTASPRMTVRTSLPRQAIPAQAGKSPPAAAPATAQADSPTPLTALTTRSTSMRSYGLLRRDDAPTHDGTPRFLPLRSGCGRRVGRWGSCKPMPVNASRRNPRRLPRRPPRARNAPLTPCYAASTSSPHWFRVRLRWQPPGAVP